MTTRTATALLTVELTRGAPDWVELLPAGPTIAARDGRRWRLADPQAIVAAYGANENYIDEGCYVTALGKVGDDQVFSIAEGVANILGYKRTRATATRHAEPEAPGIEEVAAEPHVYVDHGGAATIAVNHAPINGVTALVIEKVFAETINRGGVAGTKDLLSKSSVTRIVSVTQGTTVYAETADWLRDGDRIDWSPGGGEPATGSSYDVTYRYLEQVAPDRITDTEIVASGGIDGGQAFVSYSFKLARTDRICLDRDGIIVYLPGISAREHALAAGVPRRTEGCRRQTMTTDDGSSLSQAAIHENVRHDIARADARQTAVTAMRRRWPPTSPMRSTS